MNFLIDSNFKQNYGQYLTRCDNISFIMLEIKVGYQIDFARLCPLLKKSSPVRPVGFFFDMEEKGIIASETACPNGGFPCVEKRSDSGFIVPINQERIVAHCEGCRYLQEGFEEQIG